MCFKRKIKLFTNIISYADTYKSFSCLWYSVIRTINYFVCYIVPQFITSFFQKIKCFRMCLKCESIYIFKEKHSWFYFFNSSKIFRNRKSCFFIIESIRFSHQIMTSLTIWRTRRASYNTIYLSILVNNFIKIYLSYIITNNFVCHIISFKCIACNIPYISCKNCMKSCFFKSYVKSSCTRK